MGQAVRALAHQNLVPLVELGLLGMKQLVHTVFTSRGCPHVSLMLTLPTHTLHSWTLHVCAGDVSCVLRAARPHTPVLRNKRKVAFHQQLWPCQLRPWRTRHLLTGGSQVLACLRQGSAL